MKLPNKSLHLLLCCLLAQASLAQVCLSAAEQDLAQRINQERKKAGLPSLAISSQLCQVARSHAVDVVQHWPLPLGCNLHSWSSNGPWTSCCYTADHAQKECMYAKPKEIAGFEAMGFEVSTIYLVNGKPDSTIAPANALQNLLDSPSHRAVLLAQGPWHDVALQCMGMGMHRGYACVWLAAEPSTGPPPLPCPNP